MINDKQIYQKRKSNYPRSTAGIIRDAGGDAVVEAAILFPIMIMVFAALVLLAVYLPTRAALQHATQAAATAIATEKSDSWLRYNESAMSYEWITDKGQLENVYAALFSGIGSAASRGEAIAVNTEERGISLRTGNLTVDCNMVNRIVYKEIVVTATREYAVPVNLSIIGFPVSLSITATSTAVVQDGDEFIRDLDLAAEFLEFVSKKFGLNNISETISSSWDKVSKFLGW